MEDNMKGVLAFIRRWIGFALAFLLLIALWRFWEDVRTLKKKNKIYDNFFSQVREQYMRDRPKIGRVSLPLELANVPLANHQGIVLKSKSISIRNVLAPYNASLVPHGENYLLFFRYDVIDRKDDFPFSSYIGCAELDKNFEQTSKEFVKIETGSLHSEDPRALPFKDGISLVFNDLIPGGGKNRGICVGKLNLQKFQLDSLVHLDLQTNHIEKNWSPFVYAPPGEEGKLFFEYNHQPHKILHLPDITKNALVHPDLSAKAVYQELPWPGAWGKVRGGTPSVKIGTEYLSFFHSSLRDKDGFVWYVMGAYTFEAKPPFRITAISQYPILFETVYETPLLNTSNPIVRAIYPAGFVIEKKGEKELIHLSCGENDSGVKIITLDKTLLLRSMRKL